MLFSNGFYQGQAEAHAAVTLASTGQAEKGLKNALSQSRGYTWPVIPNQ
jgi:hypothetical protein